MNEDIQAGYYRGRGVAGSAQFGLSASGGEQVSLEVKLLDIGRTVTTIMAFAGKAMEFSIERLMALGWNGQADESFPGIDTNEVNVEVKYEPDREGVSRMRVEIKTNGGHFSFKTPMAEQQKRGFMANLAKTAAQLGGARHGAAPAAGGAKGYPADWDAPPAGATRGKGVDFG
jgi:Flp pilus assembly secretin CpaC